MALNILDGETQDLMSASYAIPDLETAVKQAIYNSIDARAKTITLLVDAANASFTAVDDGDGIQPDDLRQYVGECYASSKAPVLRCRRNEQKPPKKYGSRGAFLHELTTLAADVEIESRIQDHWTSYRKVFKEGQVVFNARSKELRKDSGTKVYVSNLFGKLPVRRKDLSRNRKYCSRVVHNIHNFCVSMSMIWPSLSFDIRYEGGNVGQATIPAAKSCRERFLGHFGQLLGNDLQYVDFSSMEFPFSIRGYFAFIPGTVGGFGQGIKQARTYYQFAFLEDEWVEECHRICSRVITDAALQILSAIPIFVLKIAVPSNHYDVSRVGRKNEVIFKNPEQLHQFLFEFVERFASTDSNQDQAPNCAGNPVAVHVKPDSHDEASDSESSEFTVRHSAQKEEHCLEDIFFSNRPHPQSMKEEVSAGFEDPGAVVPWLSSKPDSYDCVDALLDLCHKYHNEDSHQCEDSGVQENPIQIADSPRCCEEDVRSSHDTPVLAVSSTKSDYFAVGTVERQADNLLRHWINSKKTSVKQFAGALRIDNVHVLKGDREIKISKSTLAKLQVIRQVDRKFILVQADTPRGKLALCIDQHAADERVRLEQLEEEMFGRDGSLRRVEIQEHEPPQLLRMNSKEREVLNHCEDLIRSWGFDFEVTAFEPESIFGLRREHEADDKGRVFLYTTPKVEKRAASADDFRDFIQLLAGAGETYQHSHIRPPVITRLLHSRACRSAIMFGDHLSVGQCRDLIEDLKKCQLPFQCAHGRPSVVPLVEIHNDDRASKVCLETK